MEGVFRARGGRGGGVDVVDGVVGGGGVIGNGGVGVGGGGGGGVGGGAGGRSADPSQACGLTLSAKRRRG